MKTRKVKLGDVCSFYRGASVPRARMHDEGDFLYIHYGDLYKGFDSTIDVEEPAKKIPFILDSEKIKETQFLEDQDIIYVLTSETEDDLGHAYLFNNPKGRTAVSGTETTIMRVQDFNFLNPAYLNYLIHSPRFLAELRQFTRGMKVFRVNPRDVARIEIPLPPLATQTQIARILSAFDKKIAVSNRLNAKLEELARAVFEEALHDCSESTYFGEYMTISSGKRPLNKERKYDDINQVPIYGASCQDGFAREFLTNEKILIIGRVGTHGVVQ